jgi:hypothetical protein
MARYAFMNDKHQQWAKLGAASRLKEIEQERRDILAAFPELKGESSTRPDGSPRRTMSPEAKKRMSAGMRRFWAKRKAAAKTSGKAASKTT